MHKRDSVSIRERRSASTLVPLKVVDCRGERKPSCRLASFEVAGVCSSDIESVENLKCTKFEFGRPNER